MVVNQMLQINKKVVLIISIFMLFSSSFLGIITVNGNNIDIKNPKNAISSDGDYYRAFKHHKQEIYVIN